LSLVSLFIAWSGSCVVVRLVLNWMPCFTTSRLY
jgi:hypothetical protein